MRYTTLDTMDGPQAAILVEDRWVPLHLIDGTLSGDLLVWLRQRPDTARQRELRAAAREVAEHGIARSAATSTAPYREPAKVLGIGLNYQNHASDLDEDLPTEPASFLKGSHTIIGPGESIVLPADSHAVTAEAELGLVLNGRDDVPRDDPLAAVFGVTSILDQTAEDILRRNPRFLTRAKNYPTFLAFGPEVVTIDEFLAARALSDVEVTTTVGDQQRRNTVGHMTFQPEALLALHNHFMCWKPGDLLSTGTPGALLVTAGDVATCEIDGLAPLSIPVVGNDADEDGPAGGLP